MLGCHLSYRLNVCSEKDYIFIVVNGPAVLSLNCNSYLISLSVCSPVCLPVCLSVYLSRSGKLTLLGKCQATDGISIYEHSDDGRG